jgi:poly(A) polymerase Pap1
MFYRDTNVFLSHTSSTDDVFSLFARDFDLNASKIIRILVKSLKKRSIKDENIENKRRENIENSIKNNEISKNDKSEKNHKSKRSYKSEKSHRNKRSHRSDKDSESVKNRNQDN